MDIIIRKTPSGIPVSDKILCDQFADMLRKELKRNISQDPSISFTSLRSIAIKWAGRGEMHIGKGLVLTPAVLPVVWGGVDIAEANAVIVPPPDDLAEFKESLNKQQAQLDTIMKHIGLQYLNSHTSNPIRQGRDSRVYQFQADGKPICLRCNKAGHIVRFCKAQMQSSVGLASNLGPHGLVQTRDAAVTSPWPQEN